MAIGRPGPIVTDIRGKVGDTVYTRTQGGLTIKSPPVWEQPASERRDAAQAAIEAVSQAWTSDLTQEQRDAWWATAKAHPLPDRWGHPGLTNGYALFIRTNARYWLWLETLLVQDPPANPHLPRPQSTIAFDGTTDKGTITVPPTGWTEPPHAYAVYVQQGKPCTAGRNYYTSPWRTVLQHSIGPGGGTHDDAWDSPWPITAGDKVWARIVYQDQTTGAMTTPEYIWAIAT